ncbi:MAG: nicotinate phosphoribosyltransferase [Metamycoplasmataceae bacterium]
MKKVDKYVSRYFIEANKIIKKFSAGNIILMQFFQRKNDTKLCGINEVLKFLKDNTEINKYKIKYVPEGSIVNNLEPVLTLEGEYKYFGIYEGMIDGMLARSTSIATSAYHCLKNANGKEVIYMGDRADHYLNQEIDGYAVEVGGIYKHSTLAGSRGNSKVVFGSIPHVLIQNFKGNIKKTMEAYYQTFPKTKELIALVDFSNDVIKDSLIVLKTFKDKLFGVRVDTSANMVDHMFDNEEPYYGVNIEQIKRLRKALDENGGKHVKIIVSSGFDAKKIKEFEDANCPVDAYGVGEYILRINIHFSADAVILNGKPIAKEGRGLIKNPRLIEFKT